MKIALTSTPFFGVYPPNYGGLEVVVGNLARGLVELGHKVILIAPDESQDFDGGYVYRTGKAIMNLNQALNWLELEKTMWGKYKHILDDVDITNSHDWFCIPYASKRENLNLKICHTHHGGLNTQWWTPNPPFKLNIIAISKWMEKVYESLGHKARHCYNGVDLLHYPYEKNHGEGLMFLGRIDPIKSPHTVIEVARATGKSINVVGGTSFVQDQGYVERIKQMCVGDASFIGEVNHQQKIQYLQDAKALLIPSKFGEPFGLVCVEAMACGTIPIALNDGALSEIIEHGENGFICNTQAEMVDAVSRLDTINPSDCRKRAMEFSHIEMSKAYVKRYEQVLEGDEW